MSIIDNPAADEHFLHLYAILDMALESKFLRKGRKLSPAKLIGLLCCMCTGERVGYHRLIAKMKDGHCRAFGWMTKKDVPSPQAVWKARAALTEELCDQAFEAVYAACSTPRQRQSGRYRGLRIVAVDGTKLSLPVSEDLMTTFGAPRNKLGQAPAPQAGLVQLWDVGANQPVAFALTPCDYSERHEALKLLKHLNHNDVLVGDRGYPSHAIFQELIRGGIHFVIRCRTNLSREIQAFCDGSADDAVVTLVKRNRKGHQEPGTDALRVRLIRTTLPNGATEVLATDLNAEDHSAQDLIGLYRSRWRVETAFREMKLWHSLQNFSATFVNGIRQEVMAIQIFMLLNSELEARAYMYHQEKMASEAQDPHDAPTDEPEAAIVEHASSTAIRFNRRLIADAAMRLTLHAIDDLENLPQRILSNLEEIWKRRTRRKPDRSYPRKAKRPANRKLS